MNFLGRWFGVYFPWWNLGCLGFKIGDDYCDFTVTNRRIRMYESIAEKGVYGPFYSTQKSWYVLTWNGFKLLKREDAMGTWQNGHRRPPMYAYEGYEKIVQRAHELAQHFKPYTVIDWYGRSLEVISYPSPEKNSVTVLLRQFNDPTTVFEVTLEEYTA